MLGVEGMMLIGSFAGAVGSYFTGSALAGAVISVVLGAVMGKKIIDHSHVNPSSFCSSGSAQEQLQTR